jgi:hypothetical protein
VIDNDLQDIPREITEFLAFYEKRRSSLENRLRTALGVSSTPAEASG